MEHIRATVIRIFKRTQGRQELFSLSGKMGNAKNACGATGTHSRFFLRDGDVSIDHKAWDRSIRSVAVGRRNWMSAVRVRGGEAAAIIYTLSETCKMKDVESRESLADVLEPVASHSANCIGDRYVYPRRTRKRKSLNNEARPRSIHCIAVSRARANLKNASQQPG